MASSPVLPCSEMFVYHFKRFYKRPAVYTTEISPIYPINSIKTVRLCDTEGNPIEGASLPKELEDLGILKGIYEKMLLLAGMDKLLYEAQRQGRISFYMTSSGEEATHFGSAHALHPQDPIYAQYRETGVLLSRGFSLQQMLHQMTGNCQDLGKGRQMPVHYGSAELNIQTISSPLGTQLPQAVGYAYRLKLEKRANLPICYFGEGAASEGDFHAALNMAATLKTPLIFFCRNNGFAISTPDHEQYAGDGIAARGPGYGIPTFRVDGNDLWAVYAVTKEARRLALQNSTPILIEAITHRIGHHSTSDDSSAYRTLDPKKMDKNCPISRVKRFLQSRQALSDQETTELIQKARESVLVALEAAEKLPKPAIENLFTDVYDELTPELRAQEAELKAHLKKYADKYNLNEYEVTKTRGK
jgi:2-oxoisovalerate dehydrogenase E1 component alpha subunit